MRHVDVYISHDVPLMTRVNEANYIYAMIYKGQEQIETGMSQDITANGVVLEAIIDMFGHMTKSEKLDITVFTNCMYVAGMYSSGAANKWKENGFTTAKGTPIADAERWEKVMEVAGRHKLHIIHSPKNENVEGLDNRLLEWKRERVRFNN